MDRKQIALRMFIAHRLFMHKLLSNKLMTGDFSDFQTRELITLETLGENQWISMSDLAFTLNTAANTTTGIVDRLVRRKLVERRHRKVDRRVVEIGLTRPGEKLYQEYLALHMDYGEGLLEALTDEETEIYVNLIEKLVKKIESDQGET